MIKNNTIAAISTAPGIGGIAVIRISGPDAIEVADKVFKSKNKLKKLQDQNGYTALYGELYQSENVVDEGIALVFRSPHSYTGEDVVELSCHGGTLVSNQVLLSCYASGAVPAEPGEFTRRAVLNGKIDLSQAEAVMDMISANNRQYAAIAKENLSGKIQRSIETQKSIILDVLSHYIALIDYPEEDIDELEQKSSYQKLKDVESMLEKLIKSYDNGIMIRRGVKVVIIGSPNVGKSTLFNLLAGYERAIVTSIAGTTRDVVSEEMSINGNIIHISDTAGIRSTTDEVEKEGIKRSLAQLDQAGLIIAMFDGSSKLNHHDYEIIEKCKNRKALAVVNKSDLKFRIEIEELKKYFKDIVQVSAINIETNAILEDKLTAILQHETFDPSIPVLTSERQLAAVIKAKDKLENAINEINNENTYDIITLCLEECVEELGSIIGENATELILEEVFKKFCVGK